jgi:hypothetical protein
VLGSGGPSARIRHRRTFTVHGQRRIAFEIFDGRLPWLADSIASHHSECSEHNDLQVQPQAAMVDVPDIKAKFVFPANGIPAIHLSPTGHAWQHFVPPTLLGTVQFQVFHQ